MIGVAVLSRCCQRRSIRSGCGSEDEASTFLLVVVAAAGADLHSARRVELACFRALASSTMCGAGKREKRKIQKISEGTQNSLVTLLDPCVDATVDATKLYSPSSSERLTEREDIESTCLAKTGSPTIASTA